MKAVFSTNSNQVSDLPKLEEQILNYWDEINAFERSVTERPDTKPYTFYDGPPFVTGSPHYGSLLGSITKDVIPRYWTMKGYKVERQWGWDCHGLPIENMIEKDLGLKGGKKAIEALGVGNFNDACRSAIAKFDATWDVIIRRIGRWVDFKNSYKTMDKNFMESVWWAFKELHEKEWVYEGRKVILYCSRCSTPLSNFEIAYDNSYVDVEDVGTTYKFKVEDKTFVLAWSTTPWTKIGTMALAVHPDFKYVKVKQGDEFYILAESRLAQLTTDKEYVVTEIFTGTELVKKYTHFEPHFDNVDLGKSEKKKSYRLVADNFVTADDGTGVVTLAVYGEDDYRVMQEQDIPLFDYVDEEGRLTEQCGNSEWVGLNILKVNPLVDADLEERGLVYRQEPYKHSVALCHRCSTRLYYAPLPAWFVAVNKLKTKLLAENEKINWYPDYLKHGRFAKGIEFAPDWNISRTRYWGTPMPIWKAKNGQIRIVGSIAELKEWALEPEKVEGLQDIHREFVDDLEIWVDDKRTVKGKRVKEVFDCWVESSSMPFASLHYPFENKKKFEDSYPAQFISEYINQTRAWFYTMHVLSVALFGEPAFLNAHNTGIILAKDGTKMSKSKKNYTDPVELLDRSGADALRLYLMSSPVANAQNLDFSDADVENMRKRVLNIWWNTAKFFQTYKPQNWTAQEPKANHVMDRWILSLLESTRQNVDQSFQKYDIVNASRKLISFVDQLSTWYLRQSRDRLRLAEDTSSWDTFHFVLVELAKFAAPITPFLSELTYQQLNPELDSVHLELWSEKLPLPIDQSLLEDMDKIRSVVEQGHSQRKALSLKVRQPLASATVSALTDAPSEEVLDILKQELNVKEIFWNKIRTGVQQVELDSNLTQDLIAEGKAREIVRQVQQLRANANISLTAEIKLTLPEWPVEFEDYIKQKTRAQKIVSGKETAVEVV